MKLKQIALIALILVLLSPSASAVIYVPPAGAADAAGAVNAGGIFGWIAGSATTGLDRVYNGLVTIGTFVQTIPDTLLNGAVAVLMGVFFPLVDAVNFIYEDVNVLYTSFVPVANLVLNTPQWSLGWIYNWTPSHAPTITSSAETSISSSYVWSQWTTYRNVDNTLYGIASITLLIISIMLNFFLRAMKFVMWIYKKIPGKAT